jgi:hypothetical protein
MSLKPGYILHVTKLLPNGEPDRRLFRGFPSSTIQRVLGDGCHDAIYLGDSEVGDMTPPKGHVTPLADYQYRINAKEIAVQILKPANYDPDFGQAAAHWWRSYEVGRFYAIRSYLYLIIKALKGDAWSWKWDQWGDWCTESVASAWLYGAPVYLQHRQPDAWGKCWLEDPGARLCDFWRKAGDTTERLTPTPLTTQHRLEDGTLTQA